MKIEEAVKTALDLKAKNADIATYIKRKSWYNDNKYADMMLSPHGFSKHSLCHLRLVNEKTLRVHGSFTPTVEDILANDWVVVQRMLANIDSNEKSNVTTTTNDKSISKALEQLILAKGYLKEQEKAVEAMKIIFKKTYGIEFDCFALHSEILMDEEDRINGIFVALARDVYKMVSSCLDKAIKELDVKEIDEKTE